MGNSHSEENEKNMEENTVKNENEETLDLSALPDELIHSIVHKLDYLEYAKLEECSQSLKKSLSTGNFSLQNYVSFVYVNKRKVIVCLAHHYLDGIFFPRVPWHVAVESTARLIVICLYFMRRPTSSKLRKVAKLFEKNKATAGTLIFSERITFTPEDLNRLITVVDAKQIECNQYLPKEFFVENEGLNKLNSLTLYTSGCTDAELLTLKVPDISMTNDFFTDRGLNRFLKQWKRKEREISYINIEFGSSFGQRNFDTILEGLDANPIWTPALHEWSIISKLNMTEFGAMQTGDPDHLYSLLHSDAINQLIILKLSNGQLQVLTSVNERTYLTNYLDEDQYYFCFQRCRWCDQEICEHRRWLSQQRLKKHFPRLNRAVIFGFKAATYCFAIARCSQLLTGTPCFYRRHLKDNVLRLNHEYDATDSYSGRALSLLRLYVSIF